MKSPDPPPASAPATTSAGAARAAEGRLPEFMRAEIERTGPLSFARFMEWALYTPGLGYYERAGARPGRRGDFYTSVSVGRVFGELLAFFLAGRLAQTPPPWRLVEAGAHDGQLARDILGWFAQYRPGLLRHLTYWIVEPSPRRRQWQRETLKDFLAEFPGSLDVVGDSDAAPDQAHRRPGRSLTPPLSPVGDEVARKAGEGQKEAWDPRTPGAAHSSRRQPWSGGVRWVESLAALPAGEGGILFCNELLDAMPVHRLGWDAAARQWFEWGVTWDAARFQWTQLPAGPHLLTCLEHFAPAGFKSGPAAGRPSGQTLADVLPDGYTVEVSPAAMQWWEQAAQRIRPGMLVALDYGFTAEEWIRPERTRGTVRAYRDHRLMDDPLADPGQQDLTAHVNWTAIERAGGRAGLRTETLVPQGRFLTRLVEAIGNRTTDFPAWTPDRLRQLQTLTHPDHLGAAFQVLIQAASEPAAPR